LSAVCFRFETEDSDRVNAAILGEVIRRGRVFISNATIHGKFALRACITNHRTTEADVKAVVSEVIAAATKVGA
jgi:aromatic-L-amino-acid/L-tryptophan decarboxylase